MKRSKYIQLAGGLLFLLLAGGCQNSADFPEEVPEETWEVPVSFIVQSSVQSPTRSEATGKGFPPAIGNVRDLYTDRVQVNIYKRPANQTYADDETGFVFDRKMVFFCNEPTEEDGEIFRYAYGNIKFDTSYEYRASAIGYAKQKDEDKLFSFTESGDFNAASIWLTDTEQYTTPELFFGTLHYGHNLTHEEEGNVVFSYEKGKQLAGWLYRCVSGVELNLTGVPADVTEIALLARTVNTESKAMCYDDFTKPIGEQNVGADEEIRKFELAKWKRPSDTAADDGVTDVTLKGANLLPVTSTLAVRITQGTKESVVTLYLKEKEKKEEPANREIHFQRNHYYLISGNYETLSTPEMPFTITINPNWDGDADLSLGGK